MYVQEDKIRGKYAQAWGVERQMAGVVDITTGFANPVATEDASLTDATLVWRCNRKFGS